MEKINISFVMYGGLAYGGAQRQAMKLAECLDKAKYNIRYFWCEHIKDLYSTFRYPETNREFIKDLTHAGVEVVEFKVGHRDISHPFHPWFETDFFEIFSKYQTDIVFSVRSGHPEFPFVHIDKPIIEWNIFGSADNSPNLVYSVGVSPWVARERTKNGGRKDITGSCFAGVEAGDADTDLKNELAIQPGELVLGFHQRDDDNIYAEHALKAYSVVLKDATRPLRFVVLGGSQKYKMLAQELGVPVTFLPVTFLASRINAFVNTLDIFTHSAGLGESLGIAVQEAMVRGKPIVSMVGVNNGHVDVIGDVVKVAENIEEYTAQLRTLVQDDNYRREVGVAAKKRAIDFFSVYSMQSYFENLFQQQYGKWCEPEVKHFEVLPIKYKKVSMRMRMMRFLSSHESLYKFVLKMYRRFKDVKYAISAK